VISRDVLDVFPRKVCFLPESGRALVKRLASSHPATLLAQERVARRTTHDEASRGGSVDLF